MTDSEDSHAFGDAVLRASVAAQGAELRALQHAGFGPLLWNAGPAWPKHAPNLFPIIGALKHDTLQHAGASYHMGRHGFARDSRFTWLERSPAGCRLELASNAATRAQYPFAFRLEIGFAIADGRLTQRFTVENPGSETLPASIGAHPAFIWPLRPDVPKSAHRITFALPEPAPIRRLTASGLIARAPVPTPVQGRELALDPALFDTDALIFDALASTSLTYAAPGGPVISLSWEGFGDLGIWNKPGADFLCLEPWAGFASPEDFAGDFTAKPGLLHIPPGGSTQLSLSIGIA